MDVLMLIGCLTIRVFMLWATHPYVLGSRVLLNRLLLGLVFASGERAFLGCVTVLIFRRGILVVFLFSRALCNSPKFKDLFKNKKVFLSVLGVGALKKRFGGLLCYQFKDELLRLKSYLLGGGRLESVFFWGKDPHFNVLLGDIFIIIGVLLIFTVVVVVNLRSRKRGALVGVRNIKKGR